MLNRASGILLHVTSLPGPFGIGTMGTEARKFVDFLAETGFGLWQVLPFGPTGEYHSPYQCYSAFAGDVNLIDFRLLEEQGLLSREEVEGCYHKGSPYEADFAWQETMRDSVLRKAYKRSLQLKTWQKNIAAFVTEESYWLPDYACYTALKKKYNGTPWWEWPADAKETLEDKDEIGFVYFCQYVFFQQWKNLKAYANEKNIKIIGDMPIYVSGDSADAWSKADLFEFNADFSMKRVAGVPPDYFSEDGQLWGNPLYDWDAMEKDGYDWWIHRMGTALTMFDAVRIDHFRGFVAYWAVPAESNTAKNGAWVQGPGHKLFDAILNVYPNAAIIAEDLGDITEDVRQFVEETGFPGMRVMQFGFLDGENNPHLPHNYIQNAVAYTGTHDNNTVLGWLWEATGEQRERALEYCNFQGNDWGEGGYRSKPCFSWIQTLLGSVAGWAILPIQDLCGFGSDTRMNKPGIAENNWAFRITQEALNAVAKEQIQKLNRIYKRG